MNAEESRSRTEPVRENMPLQLRVWRLERLGWCCLLAVVLLALAGVFGKGPLSTAKASSADGRLQVEYQRIARNGAHSELLIHVQKAGERQLEIDLSGDLFDGVSIEAIEPQPLRSATSDGSGQRLLAAADGQGRVRLRLHLRAEGVGRYGARIDSGTQHVALRQLILP
ncbi:MULTISPECIES: hypothetical protein [unclassified Pseudomonas]|uniref:hypothetical protein n=1 Tax=unclassified Pseudomonas TaxID=196821 RepID=UPI00244B3506|nr:MULTISPECIES: hypothetical protein [unclassified Pseudomonas]MDG9925668.1 hypothetical protein [Pseudomonas sp. GD04045]MDH0037215.1 hypothetical protein [Pseudomonas sp. GD04019]